jgi:hypothetical protein
MEKEYTFEGLQRIIANIDYCWPESYPIQFKVVQKDGSINYFEAGICNIDNEEYDDALCGDGQYLSEIAAFSESYETPDTLCVLDIQDADEMKFSEIGEMLKRECDIADDSSIFISDSVERGCRMNFSCEDLSPHCIDKLNKLIE